MAAARHKEMNVSATVVATTTLVVAVVVEVVRRNESDLVLSVANRHSLAR